MIYTPKSDLMEPWHWFQEKKYRVKVFTGIASDLVIRLTTTAIILMDRQYIYSTRCDIKTWFVDMYKTQNRTL